MENENPKENDVVIESVFTFDEAVFAALSVSEKENCIDVIQKILADLMFKVQLEKHSPKNPPA